MSVRLPSAVAVWLRVVVRVGWGLFRVPAAKPPVDRCTLRGSFALAWRGWCAGL